MSCVDLLSFRFGFFFFKQKTAYELLISDWSSDVCSSDLVDPQVGLAALCRALDQAGIVERPAAIGHQCGARDAAEMKGRLVGRKDAQVDDAGGQPLALRLDPLRAVGRAGGEIGRAPV